MNWNPLDVAMDGMFCDAFGMATDGYFCAVEAPVRGGRPSPPGRMVRRDHDLRDLRDIGDILRILHRTGWV